MRFLVFFITLSFLIVPTGAIFAIPRPLNHTIYTERPPLTKIDFPVVGEPLLSLEPYAFFNTTRVPECSALVKSSKYENTIWTLSDGGNEPAIFAMRETGEFILPASVRDRYFGIRVTGTRNLDWECMTLDASGNLIIGDVGNNLSNRRNLCFYSIPEPNPLTDIVTPQRKKISFYYPTQNEFPANSRNYDCESCFALNGQIYFFTKHWSDTETVLWRVDPAVESYQAAVPVVRFNARGMVTDAALSPSRRQLAVLAYHNVWIFDLPPPDKNGKIDEKRFLTNAPVRFCRITTPSELWQLEGVTFLEEGTLLLASEQGALFRVPVEDVPRVSSGKTSTLAK